jgi:hypothetical protein
LSQIKNCSGISENWIQQYNPQQTIEKMSFKFILFFGYCFKN